MGPKKIKTNKFIFINKQFIFINIQIKKDKDSIYVGFFVCVFLVVFLEVGLSVNGQCLWIADIFL